jgi:hypothetical protein
MNSKLVISTYVCPTSMTVKRVLIIAVKWMGLYSTPNGNTKDMVGGLRSFFVICMYGYTVALCLFAAIMCKALCEKEWFVLYLFSYQIDLLALVSHLICKIPLLLMC